jgi:hypothetical protein
VTFVEQIAPEVCVDAEGKPADFEQCVNRSYFAAVMEEHGLRDSATLVYGDGERTSGLSLDELVAIAETADLLVNISGHLMLEPIVSRFKRKAYIDLDPGFTQLWHHQGILRLPDSDYYFTCGENIGKPECSIPTDGVPWRPLPPPVVLDDWPVADSGDPDRFTTIGSLRGAFGPIEYEGRTLGLKVHELRKFVEVPERLPALTFEFVLDAHPSETRDLDALKRNGWRLIDPRAAVPGPSPFQRYIQESGAEFSVSQGIYVATGSGWFSDRSVRYLASGKPVLVQDTGFSRNYPVGEGLVAFSSVEEAVAGAERIAAEYDSHSRSARALAEEYFDSDRVLGRLLQDVES